MADVISASASSTLPSARSRSTGVTSARIAGSRGGACSHPATVCAAIPPALPSATASITIQAGKRISRSIPSRLNARIEEMLQLSGAGKRFGTKLLFEEVNWLITPDERTGLVGGNGTGKSTLLKVLAGIESLDYGQRHAAKGMTIGYLPQDGLAMRGKTVFEECLSVFDELRGMETEARQRSPARSRDADPASPRVRRCRRPLLAHQRSPPRARHLHPRRAGGRGARRPRLQQRTTGSARPKSSPAAGRCASRSPSCCCRSLRCCCSTSPRTISISKPATGSKTICATTRTPSS